MIPIPNLESAQILKFVLGIDSNSGDDSHSESGIDSDTKSGINFESDSGIDSEFRADSRF